MAGRPSITNPLGAYGQDPYVGTTGDEVIVGAGGVTRGDVVLLTHSATTGRITATRSAAGDSRALLFGVAEENAAVGEIARVTIYGHTYVNGLGNVFAAGEAFFRSGVTAGGADRVAPDATAISGQHVGVVMGVRSATATSPYPFANAVPVFVGRF